MNKVNVRLITIGVTAKKLLSQERMATVTGQTSRGVFLRLASGWVVFLTSSSWRGPLTLNFSTESNWLPAARGARVARLDPGGIDFAAQNIYFETESAQTWQAPRASRTLLPLGERIARLKAIVARLHSTGRISGLGALLPAVAGMPTPVEYSSHPMHDTLRELGAASSTGESSRIRAALGKFLGYGPGLTPSGDDLVLGYLLALNRWGEKLEKISTPEDLNDALRQQAYQRTTMLSANLIACAGDGQADERLILALDGLVTGEPQADACAQLLADWGSSSGLDALLGMGLLCADSGRRSA